MAGRDPESGKPAGKPGRESPGDPREDGLDCVVGNIVVTYQEIYSRVRRCVGSQQEADAELYPGSGPRTSEQKIDVVIVKNYGMTYPGPRELRAEEPKSEILHGLEPLWDGMEEPGPGAMTGAELTDRVDWSRKYRNNVAHGIRVCGDAAIRSVQDGRTYERATLLGHLEHTQVTLEHVKRLYAHLGLAPME